MMTKTAERFTADEALLVLAPSGRDACVAVQMLASAGLPANAIVDDHPLVDAVRQGHASGAVVTEEGLARLDWPTMLQALSNQPPWSDFPLILLSRRGETVRVGSRWVEQLGNVTILERPLHPATLVSAARAAVRSRRRQRLAEAYLRERAAAEVRLRELADTLETKVDARTRALAAANDRLTAEIAERERTEAKLLQAQKMEAIGQLTGGIAHDFNNLLTAVVGALDLLLRRTNDSRLLRLANSAMRGAERGAKLTSQLLAFSRRQRLAPVPVNANAVIGQMGDMMGRVLGPAVQLTTQLADDLWQALVDPTQLEMMVLNLAINARDAMPNGGQLGIRTHNVPNPPARLAAELAPGAYVALTISDTGTGMSAAVQARAFEPFFTTKAQGKGTGLGLSQVYGFARQSGGAVAIDSREGEGTAVTIYLPRTDVTAAVVVAPEAQDNARRARVLLVDDDDDVREVAVTMLEELGYDLVSAANGPMALEALRQRRFDLLLTDVAMPAMNGVELARRARELAPGMPVLFASGYADISVFGATLSDEDLVKKPYRIAEVASRVAQALDGEPSRSLAHQTSA